MASYQSTSFCAARPNTASRPEGERTGPSPVVLMCSVVTGSGVISGAQRARSLNVKYASYLPGEASATAPGNPSLGHGQGGMLEPWGQAALPQGEGG